MNLILFDIDGTLLLSGGAGRRALEKALKQTYKIDNGMSGIKLGGRTDPQIIRLALTLQGKEKELKVKGSDDLFKNYIVFLKDELATNTNFRVLPGALKLVSSLNQKTDSLIGVATGNTEVGARMKLDRAGLSNFFSFGGFGSDAESRTDVIRKAISRGLKKITPDKPRTIFSIGDTPRDIIHGKKAGTCTLAVATGSYSLSELKACKPKLAVESLNPIEPILRFLES